MRTRVWASWAGGKETGVAENVGKQVVEIVRNTAGEHAEAFGFLDLE